MRILVVGTSCAGKSTFARALAERTRTPLIELDALYWDHDWIPKQQSVFQRLTMEATSGETWIVDGNYSVVRDLLWPRATTVIWLNYSFPTVFTRALQRTLRRSVAREELWQGNRESLRRSFFSKDSILLWVITTYRRRKIQFRTLRSTGAYANLQWIEFTKPADASRYLRSQGVNLIS